MGWRVYGGSVDAVLHAKAVTLDEDGLGVLEEAVQESGSQGAVVIEDLGLFLVDAIGRDAD